jgi:ribosomal protein L7Ae-like RNA K-turn-binding protein
MGGLETWQTAEKKPQLPAEQGIYTLLGFAQKAGRLVGGDEAVALALQKGQTKIVLLAEDLSANSLSRFRQRWQALPLKVQKNVAVWRFGDKAALGLATGKPPRGIWAVSDENFCRGLAAKLKILAEVAPEKAELLNLSDD